MIHSEVTMNKETKPEDGAFACASNNGYQQGITKREYFAAMAMQGLLVNRHAQDFIDQNRVAKLSLQMADALIKTLNEDGKNG